MNRESKISFLKTLSTLDKKINIREELLLELNENLKNKDIDEIEQIIYDLLEGLENNEEFLTEIIKLESMEIDKIIGKINNKITNNSSDLNYINEKHVYLIELLIKCKPLDIKYSKNYITKLINLVANLNNTGQIYYYWNNPTQFINSEQGIIFTNKDLVNLLYLHFLNVYSNTNNEENFIEYENQIQNNLKITIASYVRISQRIQQARKLLIPLSIISIFTEIYNQFVQINRIGQVNISEIFQIISQDESLYSDIVKILKALKELGLIYNFLEKLESLQINNDFITLILEIILEQNLYTNEILIDFCVLFSNKIPEKYKEIINNKVKEDIYWYKDYILENLIGDNETLHNETLEFLQFVENWQKNEEIKRKIKEFVKENINQIFENEKIYRVSKYLIDNNENFNLNYTTKDIGIIMIDNFIKLNKENEKLGYIFEHINNFLKKRELEIFISKLFEKIIDNLEELNDYQYKTLEKSKALLKIDKSQIEELFKKLIDIRDNEKSFLLFKLVIENNKRKLNKDLKKNFKEKLEDIKENVENEDINETIDKILGIL